MYGNAVLSLTGIATFKKSAESFIIIMGRLYEEDFFLLKIQQLVYQILTTVFVHHVSYNRYGPYKSKNKKCIY